MYSKLLRTITFLALIFIILIVMFFTKMNIKIIFSIALIIVFLWSFIYVLKVEESIPLKVTSVLMTFIVLPVFLLLYLGILNAFSGMWAGILTLGIVFIFGVLAILTMIKLDYVELNWDK